MIHNNEGLYQCYRGCQGPSPGGGTALVGTLELYEPVTQLALLEQAVSNQHGQQVVTSHTTLGGTPTRCLTVTGVHGQWCYTKGGVLAAFPAATDVLPYASGVSGTLLKLSPAATPQQFQLPSQPASWTGPWNFCARSCTDWFGSS